MLHPIFDYLEIVFKYLQATFNFIEPSHRCNFLASLMPPGTLSLTPHTLSYFWHCSFLAITSHCLSDNKRNNLDHTSIVLFFSFSIRLSYILI